MRFQPRDGEILRLIYESDGVIARRHLKELFWPGKTERAMEQRLAKLRQAGYISWPSRDQRKHNPIPEPICWLGWRGALTIASFSGIKMDPPKSDNEYQMRSLHRKLKDKGFRWVREPHWIQLAHDMCVVDFKLAIDRALQSLPNLYMQRWEPEGYFRSVQAKKQEAQKGTRKHRNTNKGIFPDGYIEIIDKERLVKHQPSRARFLIEMDMGTHTNRSFGKDKIRPGLDYIMSSEYNNLSGANEGLWLVVTKGGKRRIANLIEQIQQYAQEDSSYFYVATFQQAVEMNPLIDSIWWQDGVDHPVLLLE